MTEQLLTTHRPRLHDIDRGKGLAIVLVVLGHIVPVTPDGNEWYQYLRDGLYQFHMPFFMYLSGLVMFHSGAPWIAPAEYRPFLQRRAVRCLVPFMLFGVLTVVAKLLVGTFIAVHNPISPTPQGVATALQSLLWATHVSPAGSVWYLYVLFACYMLVPPLLWAVRRRVWVLLPLGVMLFFLPLPEYFYLDRIGHEFVFFILGGLASQHLVSYQHLLDRWSLLCIGLFVLFFVLWPPPFHFSSNPLVPTIRPALIALLSLPALHALVRRPLLNSSSTLLLLGHYSFVIYLFNTLMIAIAAAVLHPLLIWEGRGFLVVAPLLLLAGTLAPVLLKVVVLNKIKSLNNLLV